MKKLMSKKATKNAILIVSVALLLVAVTLGWFAHNVIASVEGFGADIAPPPINYQLYKLGENDSENPIRVDDVPLVPDNDKEYVYKLHIENASGKKFNAKLNLSVPSTTYSDDIRDFLQYSISEDGVNWPAYGVIKQTSGQIDLIEESTETEVEIFFKFTFPGTYKDGGITKDDHNNLSKQELKMELVVDAESDEDIEEGIDADIGDDVDDDIES